MTEREKITEKTLKGDIGIGLGIAPPPADEIDNLQSPPNSPGMVLKGIHSNTNEKIDFFILDTAVNGDYSGREGLSSQGDYVDSGSMFTTPLESTKHRKVPSLAENKEDVDLNLFSSSDSYFSRARKNPELNLKRQTKLKTRRTSDVSDRSDGARSITSIGVSDMGSSGSYYSESDTELTASPSAKYVKRRNIKKRDTNDAASEFSSFSDINEDDGIVYRSLTNKSDNSAYATSSRSRSNSRQRATSRDRDDKGKDGSATAQIFKNLLILEESLRQQYLQQQFLRYKYTFILLIWALMFIVSTYFTSFNSIYASNETSISTMKSTINPAYQISTTTCFLETTIDNTSYCVDETTESTTYNVGKGNLKKAVETDENNENDVSVRVEESGYVFKNIISRIVSIITGMTLLLFFVTGEYTRTISRPRKFLTAANKGIRQLNVKIVKVKVPWRESIFRYITRLKYMGREGGNQHITKNGVDHIKLVLNPRVFSTATREQWELYRNQFWNLEEIRRLGQENPKTK